jgi:hypothetical protein
VKPGRRQRANDAAPTTRASTCDTATASRPADLGAALQVKATQVKGRVSLTTTHDGMTFTAHLDPAQARSLAAQLLSASECATTYERNEP